MKISVCVPMFNEEKVISETAKRLSDYMSAHFEDYEIIFCDDGSRDSSAEEVRKLDLPGVRVIGYPENQGKGYAVRTAMLEAAGDVRMFTDADLAYGCDVIGQIAKEFEDHPEADLVIGSRNLSKEGYGDYTFLRRVASKAYIKVLCMVGGFRLSDSQCGCKAFSGKAAETIFPRCEVNRFAFDFEAILWAQKFGMTVRETPVKVLFHGESKVHLVRDTIKMLRDLRKMKKRIKKAKVLPTEEKNEK